MTRDDEQWERWNGWTWKQFHQYFFIGIFIEAKAVPSICFLWNLLLFQIRFCTARYLIVIVTVFPSKCVYLYQPKIDEKLENWEKSSLRSSPNPESMTQHTHTHTHQGLCKLNAMFFQACLCHPRTWSWTQWPRSNEVVRFKLPSGETHRKWKDFALDLTPQSSPNWKSEQVHFFGGTRFSWKIASMCGNSQPAVYFAIICRR